MAAKDQLIKQNKELLAELGNLYAAEDGQVFHFTKEGKAFAEAYAKPKGLKIYELSAPKKAAKKETKK